MLRQLALLCVLPISLAAACSDDGDDSGTGGAAGEPGAAGDTGTGGSSGTGGSAGSGGSSGCAEEGSGTIEFVVNGLPSGVDADIEVEGPGELEVVTESTVLDLDGGSYAIFVKRATDDDPIVRTVYDPTVESTSVCLADGATETVTVTYRAIPSSNKLWTTNANGDNALAAFASSLLEATDEVDATVAIGVRSGAGNEVAFDRDGNLWSTGATTAEPQILRIPAGSLGTSGEPEFDRGLVIDGVDCGPAIRAVAFDSTGYLWVSACGDQIVRLEPLDLTTGGDVTPRVVLSGVVDNGNLAFDRDGNLWVVSDGFVSRFDAARLDASDADPPDLVLTVTEPDDANTTLSPTDLAFDAEGNLWITDFGGNLVFEVSASDLGGSGDETVAAVVRIAIGVSSLIDRPAFDESGGLWIGLGANGAGRLSPEQLTVSSGTGDPTIPEVVITSGDLGSVGRVAFFPAAAALPLYHSMP